MRETTCLMEEVELLGGRFELRGDEVVVKYPDERTALVEPILEILSARKEEVRQLLCKQPLGVLAARECPPLPWGVRLKRYAPKTPPVAIQPCSVVTDVNKFICSYLRDLQFRLEHPKAYACAPLYEIVAKLAEVGVELEIDASLRP